MNKDDAAPGRIGLADHLAGPAGGVTVGELVAVQARIRPEAVAITEGGSDTTYAELNARVNRISHVLTGLGIIRGDRVAILSENRAEYLELTLAAAKLGAILSALNWRLTDSELLHCIGLVSPKVLVTSPRFVEAADRLDHGAETTLTLGEDFEARLASSNEAEPEIVAEPEDGLVILYTSGTTGLPKGALVSHRAQLARMQVNCMDMGLTREGAFVAWAPMFHMASLDQSLHVLCMGGKVISIDGFDAERIADHIEADTIWWLVLLPGMVEQMIEVAKRRNLKPKGIKQMGAMADLVPAHQIAEVTRLLGAPYVNSFGSTETGIAPLSARSIPIGEVPTQLSKVQNSLCRFRLVDPEDNDVPDGTPGELAFRGPTLFTGYWNAAETNENDFRGGWFHLGDMFIRRPEGTFDFVDRVKYMIKSGGENIYPAEIERVLLGDARVDDAVVVRRPDDRWGEVPVAFVARNDEGLGAEELLSQCRKALAGFKQPKAIQFIPFEDFPRSTTGKIQRHEVEKWLEKSQED